MDYPRRCTLFVEIFIVSELTIRGEAKYNELVASFRNQICEISLQSLGPFQDVICNILVKLLSLFS